MATIENLKFDLIVDDQKFNKQVQDAIDSASKLNTELSNLLTIRQTSTGITQKDVESNRANNKILKDNIRLREDEKKLVEGTITELRKQKELSEVAVNGARAREREKEKREILQTAAAQEYLNNVVAREQSKTRARIVQDREREERAVLMTAAAQERLNRLKERENGILDSTNKLWQGIKTLTASYFSIMGAKTLVTSLVQVSAEFEKQRVSLEAILGDIKGADALFNRIRQLAVMSPFNFKELAAYTKQLAAFSVPMNELYDTTKMLADVSAGLGVGMDRIILAYGQIRSASFLRGQEVRQLTEAGVPVLQELSKMLTEIEGKYVSVGEVFDKISSRQVTFEMVNQIFKDMTSEGGKFYQMQEVLADTLSGKISNLKDAYQNMFYEIGQANSGVLNATVDGIRSLIENYEKVGKSITDLIKIYGAYRVALAVTAAMDIASRAARIATSVNKLGVAYTVLTKRIVAASGAQVLLNKVSSINPYVALATAVAGLAVAFHRVATAQSDAQIAAKKTEDAFADASKETIAETAKLQTLFRQMEQAEKGTDAYNEAKKKILTTYDSYLSAIDRENLALGEQAGLYDSILQKIRANIGAKALEETNQALLEQYTNAMSEYMGRYDAFLKQYARRYGELPKEVADEIASYIKGDIADPQLMSQAARSFYGEMQEAVRAERPTNVNAGARYSPTTELLFDIDLMRQNVKQAGDVLENGMKEAKERTERAWGRVETETENQIVLKAWQTQIQKIIDEASKDGITLNLDYTNVGLSSVIEEVQNRIKDLTKEKENYKDIDNEIADALQRQLDYWIRINNEALKGKASGATPGIDNTEQIKAIQAQIDVYETLRDTYEELSAAMGNDKAMQSMKDIYGDIFGELLGEDWNAKIIELVNELSLLGQEGVKAADALKLKLANAMAKDVLNAARESANALERYQKLMESIGAGIFFSGDESLRGMESTINDYITSQGKMQKERVQLQKDIAELQKAGISANEISAYQMAKEAEIAREESNILADANKDLREEAEKWVKLALEQKGFSLDDMSRMSVRQLKALKEALNTLDTSALTDSLRERLGQSNLAIESVIDGLSAGSDDVAKKIDKWLDDAKYKNMIASLKTIKSLMGDISEYAEASRNNNLAALASSVESGLDVAIGVMERLSQGDTFGAVLAGVSGIASSILKSATEAAKFKEQLRLARIEVAKLNAEMALTNGVDTYFGTNTIRSIQNATEAIDKYRKSMSYLAEKTNLEEYTKGLKEGTAEYYYAYQRYFTQTVARMERYAEKLGASLYNEDGSFNLDTLNAIDDTYEKLSKDEREWLKNAQADTEVYQKALKQLEDAIKGVWNNVADDMTDSMINAYMEMGDAAYDLADNMDDIFSNLAQSIAKNMISSFLVENILNKYEGQVTDLYKKMASGEVDANEVARQLSSIIDNVTAEAKIGAEYAQMLFDAYSMYGIDFGADKKDGSLASGITSITENTADLLAAYINGIRADVAGQREDVKNISADIKILLGLVPQKLSLEEYLTRIEAHTADTAMNTASILAKMESIIGDGATSFVRVQ